MGAPQFVIEKPLVASADDLSKGHIGACETVGSGEDESCGFPRLNCETRITVRP